MKSMSKQILTLIPLLCISFLIHGCGGSGSDAISQTTVSGLVFAGPTAGATVKVKTVAGTTVATSAPSGSDGSFHVTIPDSFLATDLIFEASGGTFPDEATQAAGVPFGTFSAHVPGGILATGTQITIDPSSTIIQKLIAGGVNGVKTRAAAESAFASAFNYTPDTSIRAVFACTSTASTTTQRLAGLRAAAFSQLTKEMGMTPARQFELIQALADDLSDGTLDGMNGSTAVTTATGAAIPSDIANRFANALMTFQTSELNKSRLTPDKMGAPPFVKKGLTPSYLIEYVPGAKGAAQGKTSFRIKLSNRSDGSAATGRTIILTPKMYMATTNHSAPVDTVNESTTPGTYDCAVYYQMASGPGMGVWELKLSIGEENVTFYPPVAMSMGTTSRATLKGVSDFIDSGTVKRTYNLFNDGSTFGMSSTFKLFIAASDDIAMMRFPTVSLNSSLTGLTVSTMQVEISLDNGSTWSSMTDSGGGHWTASGLSGLANGGTIRIKVNINGEQKTTGGLATISSSNLDYALFTIMAGM